MIWYYIALVKNGIFSVTLQKKYSEDLFDTKEVVQGSFRRSIRYILQILIMFHMFYMFSSHDEQIIMHPVYYLCNLIDLT